MEVQQTRRITFIRHFQQISHSQIDPAIKPRVTLPHYPHYDRIICSPYLRCRQSARLINAERPTSVDARLSEYQAYKTWHRAYRMDAGSLVHGPVPGATETWADCTHRLDAFLADLLALPSSQDVLVVTHGIVVRYMQLKLCGATVFERGRSVPFGTGFSVKCE